MSLSTDTMLEMLRERELIDGQFKAPVNGANNSQAWILAQHEWARRTLPATKAEPDASRRAVLSPRVWSNRIDNCTWLARVANFYLASLPRMQRPPARECCSIPTGMRSKLKYSVPT